VPEQPSIWEQGRQYPDLWAAPSGAPADVSLAPPETPDAAVPDPGRQGAPQSRRRHRWALPKFPTGMWLSLITVLLIGFVLVHPGRGQRPVFVPPPVLSDDVAEAAEPVVPPTPSPSMVAELDQPLPTIPPPPVPTTMAPPVTETATSVAPEVTEAVVPATVPPAPPATSEPPATAPATEPVTTPAPTPAPTTTAVPATVPDAPPTATTSPAPPPTTVPQPTAGPRVEIIGRVGPCRFGNSCLIAGFRIHDFDVQPTGYVCEFADGSRFLFRMGGDGADYACATGSPGDSITIEVSGIRSETFTAP
jgi:hypothetical protein